MSEKLPKAKARFGFQDRVVVDECPHCGRKHVHGYSEGNNQREADCFQGQYILDFTEAQS